MVRVLSLYIHTSSFPYVRVTMERWSSWSAGIPWVLWATCGYLVSVAWTSDSATVTALVAVQAPAAWWTGRVYRWLATGQGSMSAAAAAIFVCATCVSLMGSWTSMAMAYPAPCGPLWVRNNHTVVTLRRENLVSTRVTQCEDAMRHIRWATGVLTTIQVVCTLWWLPTWFPEGGRRTHDHTSSDNDGSAPSLPELVAQGVHAATAPVLGGRPRDTATRRRPDRWDLHRPGDAWYAYAPFVPYVYAAFRAALLHAPAPLSVVPPYVLLAGYGVAPPRWKTTVWCGALVGGIWWIARPQGPLGTQWCTDTWTFPTVDDAVRCTDTAWWAGTLPGYWTAAVAAWKVWQGPTSSTTTTTM